MLVLIVPEFLEGSKNPRIWLVTLALGDPDALAHGKGPEQNVASSSTPPTIVYPHPRS